MTALAVLSIPSAALGFCRTTTCIENCPLDELGCKTTGVKLAWPTQCVGFSIQRDGTENIPMKQVRPVIKAAFATWVDLPCPDGVATLTFVQQDDAACHAAEFNEDEGNANIVLFQDYKWQYTDVTNTLAKTTVTYDPESGVILDADLELNHAFNNFTVSDDAVVTDLQSVIAHEVGHFVGLDHSHVFDALMTSTYSPGAILRDVHQDDIAGICDAYPPGRPAPCNADPIGGFVGACGGEEADGNGDGGCAMRPVDLSDPSSNDLSGWGRAGWVWIALGSAVAVMRRRRGVARPGIHRMGRL